METPITDGFRDIFLAGVGALSLTGEKAKQVLDELVERGQVTVEQGRKINEELRHRGTQAASGLRDDAIRAYVRSLSAEDREKFAESIRNLMDEIAADGAQTVDVEEAETVEDDGE